MNLILLEERDFDSPSTVILTDRRFHHIITVVRAIIGDRLKVGMIDGQMGEGTVTTFTPTSVSLAVDLRRDPPQSLALDLVLALPRPKFLKRTLQTAASLGIKNIYLLNSYRVEKVYWSTDRLEPAAIRESLVLGLEQAVDTVLPKVHLKRLFKPFVEDELPALVANRRGLVAHPHSPHPCPYGLREPLLLVVGPEGGFIDYEIEALKKVGLQDVSLGARILKVETAVTALVSRLT